MTAPNIELTRTGREQTHEDTLIRHRHTELARIAAGLQDAHLEAAEIAAELDLDQASGWARADAAIAEVTTEAYHVTALITGQPTGSVARHMQPIARLRELATAQARLLAALDRPLQLRTPAVTLAAEAYLSVQRVCMLNGQLRLLIPENRQPAAAYRLTRMRGNGARLERDGLGTDQATWNERLDRPIM